MRVVASNDDPRHWKKRTLTALAFFALPLVVIGHENSPHVIPETYSVPGPPEEARLEVIGANTLRTTFAPPLFDGGSPVLSYLVEWDKEAGIPEVQRITTSQNLNSNEIQSITTSTPDINEIQVVRTTATEQAEVQAITVSPPYGDTTIDSAYSFALSIDTISVGGSLQYSGQISANAAADGARSSIAQILENMANVHERPAVERSAINPDGGHTYLVTFPASMGNVPEMEVFMSDLPVSITTLKQGNELEGSFRLEFEGELTADIPHDASSSEMQSRLESLGTIGAVSVSRSMADEQGGFTWEIEFLSDSNGGNLPAMAVHGDGLRTSNPIGGAHIEVSTGRDGSYIAGSFTLAFRGEETNPIPYDADASKVKEELEMLSTIARVHVERTPLDIVGGCTWTVSFLEEGSRLHRGDLPALVVDPSLTGTPGETPSIVVMEERQGTEKEVQTITVDGGGGSVDPSSSFRLRFEGEETGDILALPLGGSTCLGSTKAQQVITTSTVDTSGVGGDDSVSHLTSFALTYDGHATSEIMANGASCEDTSAEIANELMKLPRLYEVEVSGADTSAGDEGCAWTVTFLSVMGNPELMEVSASNGDLSVGPAHSVTVGDEYSIIRDTVAISQPAGFEGDVNLIQSELSKLSTIGTVTVSPASAIPDSFGQCTWEVTFESKAGDIVPLEVARSGTNDFSTDAELNSGNRIIVSDDTVRGTAEPVSGDFRLEFDGELTGYLPYDASPELMKSSLDALSNIGDVAVTRVGPDVNRCYTWDVTFVSDLGPLPLLKADDIDLEGTVASLAVSKATIGILPPFDGPDYGSLVVADTPDLSILIPELKQGIPYYVRIRATNEMGTSPSIMPYPPVETPYPQPPSNPSAVSLESKDGSTLAVTVSAPFHDGGKDVTSYRVDYSTLPFVQERQRISLTCSPEPEIQSIATSAVDINEIQYLVLDSSYTGNGEVLEVQNVLCDASGGTFGLTLGGETAYISHDANADDIKESLESLLLIDEVSVVFNNGKTTACAPYDGVSAGDFSVTFESLSTMAGDLPMMAAETSGLDGARHVDVITLVNGDAPLSGSLKLSFRGAISDAIDVSLDSGVLASAIDAALEALDTIQQDGVAVSEVTLANGGYEKIFRIEFQGSGVGGNVESLVVVPEHLSILGSSADAFVLSDGESYSTRNGVDSVTSLVGNELAGQFRLRLRGHTTKYIPFNSSVDEMKARLEELPNVGEVDVQRSGPSKEMAYVWTVTFLSNPGYFPPASRDVDDLETVNDLTTSVESDASASITVETIREGHDRVDGQFEITYDDGQTSETTRPLQSFISADDLKVELESLSNVGQVSVVRSKSLIGYEWDIEFTSCALKNGVEVCNDGDLLPLAVSSINLQGCGGTLLAVSELTAGSGADSCPNLSGGLCSDVAAFDGEYPIVHHIQDLALGTPYYVQVRLKNSQSHGFRRLSTPTHATPQHNPPGPPPPVTLIESTSTSITVGWQMPTTNGGKVVSGYELWMDGWTGGETFMVYDGAGSPDVMQYQLTTSDSGVHSQVVETGRQYRFQVRAINNCDTEDPSRSCFGEFSDVQLFTVRDPRPPLPPSMPQRDAATRVVSSSEAVISVSWSPPVDNGGSPITGYILYMKEHDGTMSNHLLGPDTTTWLASGLRPGEVYRFHVVATNALGESGNSPVLSTLAAMHPGLSYAGVPEYSKINYRPVILDVQETSLTARWSHLPADIAGGSPITGFKVYLYQYEYPLLHSTADHIKEEVQHVVIPSKSSTSGTFTMSFRGYETSDVSVDATAETVKIALENLPSINLVNVEDIADGWSVTFLSEAGDLPLIETTWGRLSNDAKIIVTEVTKGDAATLVYDGSETPGRRTFEALNLTPDSGYAFKVAPVNAIGDGILSSASIVTVARAGASASKTTASGSSLSKGIAGSIQEEQIVSFLSDDCTTDQLILSFESSDDTANLCDSTAGEFEAAIEGSLGVGDVHVSREEVTSPAGHSGYSWSVTFISRMGDVPMIKVDRSRVGNGRDVSGELGLSGNYVVEFLKGQSNEFIIEPKKATGSVVKDISTYEGMEGGDVFFTELWTSDVTVVDGSHTWYSDGGVSSYNTLLYIEQMIAIPKAVGTFHLSMDTRETQQWGRIDGVSAQTSDMTDVSEAVLTDALSQLPNVGKVDVVQANEDNPSTNYFVVTFRDVYGEYPLLTASDPSIVITRNNGQFAATEVQTITMSVDKPFLYEVQRIAIPSSSATFDLSFKSGPRTNSILCNFATMTDAHNAVTLIESELNALPDVKVQVDATVAGTGDDNDPWQFKVTFLEPVGALPLLDSDNAQVSQLVQGESTLSGSIVLAYEGEYTDDISFDASAKDIKDKLEMLDTVEEVNVRKIDKYTGYQWVVSFTGNAGNLPLVVAHDNVFEIQSIETIGGQPTPLGGTFTLSYLDEETGPLMFDSSEDIVKSALESLPSIDRVDVSRESLEHGQCRWLVTFRLPKQPALLIFNGSGMSGTLIDVAVSAEVDALSPSLVATSGSPPIITVEEKVPGLPSYTGQYRAEAAGRYSLAVLQLEAGGLDAKYYDNQWLMDDPVIERVDPTINFDWGSNIITEYGRDYVSVRWWGKVRPETTEPYTFYLQADDGARLYLDHVLIIDLWGDHSIEKKATIALSAGSFHDLKVEYKEITGDAHVQLEWSSRSLRKQIISPSQLFHPSHIVGSPFLTSVSPGAADYPYSDFIDQEGEDRQTAIAGDSTSFYLQAKDTSGNNKNTTGDSQGDVQSPEEQFTVDIVGSHGSTSGTVTYLHSGQYRVDYTVLRAGNYQVHVKTGDTDIYCGLGEENKCSPFDLTVLPGATLASNCEAESSFDPVDDLVEARAGEIGKIHLQAKDAFGNNRMSGGDDVIALFKSTANPDIQYRGNVHDRNDGSYLITHSIPLAGPYLVSIQVDGEPVQYCVGPSGQRWDAREYDGISVYSSPSFCSLNDNLNLNVIHRELHGVSSTLVERGGLTGLSSAVVGIETGFVIEARDKFGNLRSGTSTSNIVESGDGASDAFLVRVVGPAGEEVTTSTAVEILSSSDSTVSGYFRLSYGGKISHDIPHDSSASAMQTVLSSIHGSDGSASSVQVSRTDDVHGNHQWKITFVDHLDVWSINSLAVLAGSDGFGSVSDTMSVTKQASAGVYPISYTLWKKGLYELSVISGTTVVGSSSYTIEVSNGSPQASSSSAYGEGLEAGVAGETFSFEVQVRDVRQPEIQSIKTSATVIDYINEVQQIRVLSSSGESFQLEFRGQQTAAITVGTSTLADIEAALEALPSVGQVDVTSSGSTQTSAVENGDEVNVEFLTELGSLELMTSSGPEVLTKVVEGEAPHRAERHAISCNADGGYIILSHNDLAATIDFDDDLDTVTAKLSLLVGGDVTIIDLDSSVPTVCDAAGRVIYIDFPISLGNVEPFGVNFDALENGSMMIYGDGEGNQGAVDGISPIMGYFSITHDGAATVPISVDATAEVLKAALEDLPTIGSVSVTKDAIGIRQGSDGQNIVAGTTSLFSVWSVTFAVESDGGCQPGSWDACPANIGDVEPLAVDESSITYHMGATQQQPAPMMEVLEIQKGYAGNPIDDDDGELDIGFSLSHNLHSGFGIESHEVHTITCSYSPEASDATGSFELEILDRRVIVDAQTSMHDLKLLISSALGLSHTLSSAGSTHGTVCHLGATAVTKLTFDGRDGSIPPFYVHSEQNVVVSARNVIDAVDEVEYLGGGRYLVKYTPTVSGHYSSSVTLGGDYLWTDLSAGVVVDPANASAHHVTHDSSLVGVAGKQLSLSVLVRDRFGNMLSSALPNEEPFVMELNGVSDVCSGELRNDKPNATIEEDEGYYTISYTPSLAGVYDSSIMLRSSGGLLATYYKNEDFTQPVYGNKDHNSPPYHETQWCAGNKPACDSTRLDKTISFDWGFESPLAFDPSFPMDSFSVAWDGEILADATDEYIFTVHLNGGARLSISGQVVIDNLEGADTEYVLSDPVILRNDTFSAIKLEYVHFLDDAHVRLSWQSSTLEEEIVPSSALYYSRHISGSSPSPFSVQVSPGGVDASSTAEGAGLSSCVSLQECGFVVQTKDPYFNNRYNDGSDPGFAVSIVGNGGWAGEGRINSVVSSPPLEIDGVVTNNEWAYVGEADVAHLAASLTSTSSFVGSILRGDRIVVDGALYTVSATGVFDSTTVPLVSPYLGPTKTDVSVFKASSKESCATGTHTVKYTPSVRGAYLMDVKLPSVLETQRVTTSVHSHSSLSGAFTLAYHDSSGSDPLVSGSIEFDATSDEVRIALESIETIGSVEVSLRECSDPSVSCSWEITFSTLEGDVNRLVPNKAQLSGDVVEVQVEEIVKGQRSKSITGFPRTIDVSPAETSPARTTAYGRGLVEATAGQEASFNIQPKDAFGNDRLAEQGTDLFAVSVYHDDLSSVIEGNVERADDGYYAVKYVPVHSGLHTISVVQAVAIEKQAITTGFNTKARGGTFKIKLGHLATPPISWDADEDAVKIALDSSMESVSTFNVQKDTEGLFNFKYTITFQTLLGDAPSFTVDTSALIGNANDWDVTTLVEGKFSHIKEPPTNEIQRVELEVLGDPSSLDAFFTLSFFGQNTDPIPWNADASVVVQKLEMLSSVGDIEVSLEIDSLTNDRSWGVTFKPSEGKSANSIHNFGNLPSMEVASIDADISVEVTTVEDGGSPYQALVYPAEPSSANTTAYDQPGVRHFEGLSTGVYKSDTHFFIQSRDEFSNEIQDGPLSEVQIIETSSSSQIGGHFEVSLFNTTVRIEASASPSELEMMLQTIPGVGVVTVSSNSAKDLVVGKSVAVTQGLSAVTPSEELSEFVVGDWIRIGHQDTGPLFAITDMAEVAPFTLTLSAPYLEQSHSSLNIYQHGSSNSRQGYQYIIRFDDALGDLPGLGVDGTLLEGDDAGIQVTSCDWNVHQSLRTYSTGTSPVGGYFYLVYGTEEQTRMLSAGISAEELEEAILTDVPSVHDVAVTHEQDHGLGASSWTIQLLSIDGDALLFFAEGHLLTEGTVSTSAICPVASRGTFQYSAWSVAGRRGEEFVVTLGDGEDSGTVDHVEGGRYLAKYVSPRVGEYSLSIMSARHGGLSAEYFNNRWLYGAPSMTRVDPTVDFDWGENDPITPSGNDFVSIRWTGYIKPSYSEQYTFTMHVTDDDAVRMWVGHDDEPLVDTFDNEADELDVHVEVSASTADALTANQLISIKIEYRENRGSAKARLFWESVSQPFAIIDESRLFYNASHVDGSPFDVTPQAIESTRPTELALEIEAFDSLSASWSAPEDDGGTAITKYLVESWDANEYGITEKQQLRVKDTITGGSFELTLGSFSVNVPVGSTALEMEDLLESLPNVGDATVLRSIDGNNLVYDIEYLTDVAPIPVMTVSMIGTTPEVEQSEYCVCARGSLTCDSGSSGMFCDADSTRVGTVATQSEEVTIDGTLSKTDSDDHFAHTIRGLVQSSNVPEGFGIRVSAGNSDGYGMPSLPVFLKPMGPPSPPAVVELERVASNPSSLALHFTSVTDPHDKGSIVSEYLVEWSTSQSFSSGAVFNATLSAGSAGSPRLQTYNDDVTSVWNLYLVEELTPGVEVFVRVAAVNEAGTGSTSSSLSLMPGSKPDDLEGVQVDVIPADDTVSVAESSSSLQVSWRAPSRSNGFDVSSYLVEYSVAAGVDEVQEIVTQPQSGNPVQGTFTLSYSGDRTSSLSIDSSAEDVQSALENLSSIRSVRVWRSGSNPNYVWKVTFLSEHPSGVIMVEESTKLVHSSGEIPSLQVNVVTPGVLPTGYAAITVDVDDPLQTQYHHTLTDLSPGLAYFVQVSAANQMGYGPPQAFTRGVAPPIQKPSNPNNVILNVASSQSLEVVFSKPDSDGGETVSMYRIEWDADEDFGTDAFGSYSFVAPSLGCEPCAHQITGLDKGQDYYVRVYAYNSHGYSTDPGLPTPLFLSPKTTPDPPAALNISPQSDTRMQVSFPPSVDDGGAPVTKYKVEWNAMGFFAGMDSINDVDTALLFGRNNVQSITVSAEEDDLGGYFRVAFGGHATDEISVLSTANDMKLALEALPTVGATVVSREYTVNGWIWSITFLSDFGAANQGITETLKVSTDPAALPHSFVEDTMGVPGTSLSGTDARLVVVDELTAYKGFEQQTLTAQCSAPGGILDGEFSLSFEGVRTNEMPFDVSASDLKRELETVASVGKLKVQCQSIDDSINAFQCTMTFVERLGNAPLFEVHDQLTCSGGIPVIFVTESVQGLLPNMDGPYAGEVELDAADYPVGSDVVHTVGGLMPSMPYHFRVSAWNGAGKVYGKTQHSAPPIMTPMDKPDPPSSVEMSSKDDETLQISWDASLMKGGAHRITAFDVELVDEDTREVFSYHVENNPEVQVIVLESSADDMGGTFVIHFMSQSSQTIAVDADVTQIKQALEGILTIDTVSVSILSHTQDSTASYGRRWMVTFTSQSGNLPSLLVDTGSAPPSTIATGGTIFGSSSVIRVETVSEGGVPTMFVTPPNLSHDAVYTSRVSAFNGHRWSDPSTSARAISPSKGAPSPPLDVHVNVLSDTEVGVSWSPPIYSGGEPISSYRIEWDTDSMFDHASATVGAMGRYHVVTGLDPSESYFVRVMAYSSKGFSRPQIAIPFLTPVQTIGIELVETTGSMDFSETFQVRLATADGFDGTSGPISVYATSNDVEDELNQLGIVGAISVDREDSSSVFDQSGIETNSFDMRFIVSLFGGEEFTLSVVGDGLGPIIATVVEEN